MKKRLIKTKIIGEVTLELVQEDELFVIYWVENDERLSSEAFESEEEALKGLTAEINTIRRIKRKKIKRANTSNF